MAEIQAGTIFSAIAPNTNTNRRSAIVNRHTLVYTIEDIAAAVGGDVDLSAYLTIADADETYQPLSGMSSYLTTANAATTYQAKPIKSAQGLRSINANVPNNSVVSAGVANSTGGSSYGSTRLQVQSGFTWSVGGTVLYTFRNTLLNSTSNIFLSIQAGTTSQMFTIVSFYITDGELEILVKNTGSVSLSDFDTITINWNIMS